MRKKLVIILEILLIYIIFFQIYLVYQKEKAKINRENNQNIISEIVKESNMNKKNNSENLTEKYLEELKQLKKINNKVVGIIKIPNTKINYPILQSKDNEYFLNHDIKDNYNVYGEVFMDYRNSKDFSDDNLIIYGHNIRSKKDIFNELLNYENVDFLENHKEILLVTKKGIKKYVIFSDYVTDPYDKYRIVKFSNNKIKDDFINKIKNKSIYKEDLNINECKQIITLSTCKEHNSRMVVHGLFKEEVEN